MGVLCLPKTLQWLMGNSAVYLRAATAGDKMNCTVVYKVITELSAVFALRLRIYSPLEKKLLDL